MPKRKEDRPDFDQIGKQYGKPDIERLGIFIENPYLNGKGYVPPFASLRKFKGRNMLSEGRKSKCGTQHGYFESQFKRLYEGEPWKKVDKKKAAKIRQPFIPNGPGKWTATPGDYYGCFSGNIEAFSNVRRPQGKLQRQPGNFMTNPVKQGGFGYADICLSKYPEHLPDPYNPKSKSRGRDIDKKAPMVTCHFPQPYFHQNPYVDPDDKIGPTYVRPKERRIPIKTVFVPTGPSKWQGGCHAGCFTPYPEWEPPKGKPPRKLSRGDAFYPQSMALKTMNTVSIVQAYTDHRISHKNHNHYEPNYTKFLLN